jgi:hypothetical protein
VLGTQPSGFSYNLINNIANTSIDLQVTAVAGQPGDYNEDGHVDAADYVAWRKLPANFGGDPAGYNTWRANFGEGSPGSGGSGGVPEPAACALALIAFFTAVACRRRHR